MQVPYTAIKCSACCSELPPLSADVLDELADDEDEKVWLNDVACLHCNSVDPVPSEGRSLAERHAQLHHLNPLRSPMKVTKKK